MIQSIIQKISTFRRAALALAILVSLATLLPAAAFAQTQSLRARITAPIDSSSRAVIAGSRPARAHVANDIGKMPADTNLHGITLVFSRTPAQQADLNALTAAQQDPASPLYHQWLTPDQFAARFGMAASDIAQVQAWLQQQGFAIDGVSRSRDRIRFSGTEGQVASAFGSEIHYYKAGATTRFAPATDLSVPAALGSVVTDITNLSSFHPRPRLIVKPAQLAQPNFTSAQTGSHYLTPKDIATIYDLNPAYNAGYTGSNQSIAIVGQSFVDTSDITNFQSAAGLTPKLPTMVLMPNTGASAVNPLEDGDEAESDLDLEYSGGIAKGANIFFVYTGNSGSYGVFDALQYAIDNKIAPIISISYGDCELDLGAANFAQLDAILQQGAAQGQTVISAAGDDGSTDCYGETQDSLATQEAVSVDYPSSSQYVTGMGGTEFPTADVAIGNNTYFSPQATTDTIGSALSYIPEQVWNDDTAGNLSSGGGGVSVFTARPSWQTGVPGITAGSFRLVPDISLDASPNNAGFLYCSSDETETGIDGSCSNGFRDANDVYLTSAGGTSFDAPIFAGVLAIISQKINASGLGNINPTLYSLAANPTTYASAFHDITSGNNECLAGAGVCISPATTEYAATTGYDEASGLGSLDFYNLLSAWPAGSGSAVMSSTTTLSAATLSPATGATDNITITVAPTTGTTPTPTGTVSVTVDGTVVNAALALVNGTATYAFSSTILGSHVVVVQYSGATNFGPSSATVALTVGPTFALTASNISVASGSTGTSTITITPSDGYTGTVEFEATTNSNLNDSCYAISNASVTGTAAVTTVLTIYTSISACNSVGAVGVTALHRFNGPARNVASANPAHPGPSPFRTAPLGVALAGLLAMGCFRKRARRLRKLQPLLAIVLLAVVGFGLSGCSNNSSGTAPAATNANQAPGTYSLKVVGVDTSNAAITASVPVTLTVN